MARVLVIDDDPDVVDSCRVVLEADGHQVIAAHNKEDGLSKARSENPNLIILDVMMAEPDDGFYVAQKIRSEGNKVPILMLTSVGKVTGFEFGKSEMVPVDDFVEKPVDPEILIARVKKLLGLS